MPEENDRNSFAQGVAKRTVLLTAGRFVSKLLVFFMVRLYTACLSPAEYSLADLLTDTANLLIPLASLGISDGIFRNAADPMQDKQAYLTAGLAVLGGGSLLFLALSPILNCIPLFEGTAWLIVLYVLLSNLHAVVSQYLYAVGRVRLFAGQGILNTVLIIALNLVFLPGLDLGVTGYVMSTFVADGLTTLFLILYTRLWRSVRRMSPREIWATAKPMLRFCLPLIPATVCWWVTSVSDRYMISAMRSAAENGLYAAAYKIPTILTYAVSIFSIAWKGSVSAEADDPARWEEHYTRSWCGYVAVAFVGGGGLILLSRLLAGMLYAEEYRAAWTYIPVLTVATVLAGLDTFLDSVYFTARRTVWSLISAASGAGLNLFLNVLWIPRYGAMGASVATAVSYLCVLVIRLVTTHRLIPFRRECGRLALNTAVLALLACCATMAGEACVDPKWGWPAAAAACLVLIGLNAKTMIHICSGLARRLCGRRGGKENEKP